MNHTTREAKEAIALAFERNGGIDRLVEWIGEDPKNESLFLSSIWPKLIPLQVNGSHRVEHDYAPAPTDEEARARVLAYLEQHYPQAEGRVH